MEEYKNCFVTCASFGLPTVSGCMGDCDIGFQTTTFPCDDGTLCMYIRHYQCLASCSGTWSEWEQTSECNRNCNGGTYTRQRFCESPDGSASTNCEGAGGSNIETGTQVCNTEACPVLGEWSNFTTCSHSCDGGNQTRTRYCLEATGPSPDGIGCPSGQLSYNESQPCMTQACPAYGAYVNSTCSVTCGGGNLTRTRNCSYEGSPSSLCPGASATGEMSVIVTCNTQNCSYWTDWTEVGNCSEPCDGGMISRTRDCVNNGATATDCDESGGNSTQTDSVPCNTFECLGYSNWTAIDACNATCDGGYQTWERNCIIPGSCTGLDTVTEQRECNTDACEYGAWSNITECSEACDGGTWTEQRNCITAGCSKTETRTETCNPQACEYGAWSNITECSAPCDGGTWTEQRNCITADCSKSETRTEACNLQACEYGAWSNITECSEACDGGTWTEQRNCITADCSKTETRTETCNPQACEYGAWSNITECSAPCDGGSWTEQRNCITADCSKTETRTEACNLQACEYGAWSNITECSEPCDGGTWTEQRNCITADCSKTETRTETCNPQACEYGPWSNITECSESCDGGTWTEQRICITADCSKTETRTETCNLQVCEYGAWSNITECSEPCDGGTWTEQRNCIISGCSKTETRTETCNLQACEYGAWSNITECNEPCGNGTWTEQRNCITTGCSKTETRTETCNHQDCEYGAWSNITECSESCGNGTWTEQQSCITVGCSKTETRTETCINLQDCTFGNWTDVGSCSVICGGGTLDQERLCTFPGCSLTENRTISCNTDDCPATIAGAGGNIPLLISIASIVGALAISAAVYMTVTACLGLVAVGAEKRNATATYALVINAIQVGTLGIILWRGKTKLKIKNRRRNLFSCCGGDNNEPEYGDVVPMVRIFGRKTPGESREALDAPADDVPTDSTAPFNTSTPYTTDTPQTSAPYTSGPLQGNPQQSGVGVAELTKWAGQMIADSKNINKTEVYDLNKSTNNNSNDDRMDASHYYWVHTRSFSSRRSKSIFKKDRESVYDHTYTVMK
ncbi:uncharacterized protein LOC143462518 isoform X2 [Clavelina lepadiformis]|uniref:uncharacterized protein LOC143462518 isoform X2 n=1 Tax=Clavelina lepadiformis TaxID=159417 RepID=UPI004041754F